MSPPVEKLNIVQLVNSEELDELLADPGFLAVWWQVFEDSHRRQLERSHAEPIIPWEWEVRRDQGSYEDEDTGETHHWDGYTIHGACRAVRR